MGYGLVVFDLSKYECIDGPGVGSRITESYLQSLYTDSEAVANDKPTLSPAELMMGTENYQDIDYKYNGILQLPERNIDAQSYHVYQWMPIKNDRLARPVWKYFLNKQGQDKSKPPDVDFVDVYNLGCVSNALHSARCGNAHCLKALQSTDKFTTLPQIEIILE